ncbi:MAG: prepilin-type N-terminal cleavage/methylation domain-containing protein [Thermoanaerobaculaceae bacterium]|jgi:general secretion pathway protein G|nr:prepilin-type N-terminal cleavage/methylation domain-containing protein [Thermoanaerobaculaceae bacterium]
MQTERGFTLVELLVVVTILGLVVGIAVYSLADAVDRGRQKRTVADLRALATAIEAYSVDFQCYPRGEEGGTQQLEAPLTPTYIRSLPRVDGWRESIGVILDPSGVTYTIYSGGGDHVANRGSWRGGPTTSFNDDIVFAIGGFVQWPEGTQTR